MYLTAHFYPVTFLIFIFAFIFTIVKYKNTKRYNAFLFSSLKWFFISLAITIIPSMFLVPKTPAYKEWTETNGLGIIIYLGFVVLIIIGIFALGITSIILAERYEKIELQKGTITLEETKPQKNKGAAVAALFVVILFAGLNIIDNTFLATKNFAMSGNTKSVAMRYLKDKYGDHGFEYVSTEKDMHTNTFGTLPHLEGYQIEVRSREYGFEFSVEIDAEFKLNDYDNPENIPEYISDSFYTTLFEKQYFKKGDYYEWRDELLKDINDKMSYLQKEMSEFGDVEIDDYDSFNIDYDITIFSKAIPQNYGKIPTREELEELTTQYAVNHTKIAFRNFSGIPYDKKETMTDEEKEKTVTVACEKIANKLVQVLDTKYDINIKCYFVGFDYGNVIVNKEKTIIKFNKETTAIIDL